MSNATASDGKACTIEVVAAVLTRQGRALCMRRAAGRSMEGYWEFPGGKVEPGETHEAAIQREIREELQIDIEVADYLGFNLHRPESSDVSIKLHAFAVERWSGTIFLTDHDLMFWADCEQIASLKWCAADIPFVEKLTTILG